MRSEFGQVQVGKRLAMVGGEPGIGKTRLVSEFATEAHDEGAVVLFGRTIEGLSKPYLAIVEALEHCMQHLPADQLDPTSEDLARLAHIAPEARTRFGEPPPRKSSPGSEQFALFKAVLSLLQAASREGPVLLVLDDLHWADEGTLLLLQYLLSGRGSFEGMVLATYRPTDVADESPLARALAQLGRDPGHVRVELDGLSASETLSLMTDLAGHGLRGPEADLASMLQAETRGNPLFVTELVRSLIATGDLEERDGRWRLRQDLAAIRIPASITDVIRQRVEGLGDLAREALMAASTVGQDFEADLVAQVLGSDLAEMGWAWDAAERAALVTATPKQGILGFTHPLVRRAIQESLGSVERSCLHRRIAEAMESATEMPDVDRLALHWSEASGVDPAKSRAWAARAGEQALERFDADAAAYWYREALDSISPTDEREREEQCAYMIGLGCAQRLSGVGAFRETLLEAARTAESLGRRDLLAKATLCNTRGLAASASGVVDEERIAMLNAALREVGDRDSPERALLLSRLGQELAFSRDWDRRKQLSDNALEIARRVGDRAALAQVLCDRFVTTWMPATLVERLEHATEAVALADELGDPWLQFQALHWRGVGLVQSGELEAALAMASREQEVADRLGDPTTRWISTYDQANFAIIGAEFEQAEALATQALSLATESDQPDAYSFFASQLVNIRYEQGRLPELKPMIAEVVAENPGLPAFRAVLALAYAEADLADEARDLIRIDRDQSFAGIPEDVTWLSGHVIYAHVAAATGDRAAAEILYPVLEPWVGQLAYTGVSIWGDVGHALGRLATLLGEYEDAEMHFTASTDLYCDIGAPALHARGALDFARLAIAREKPGDLERATSMLDEAAATARRLGAAGIERRAIALRDHVRTRKVVAGAGPGGRRMRMGVSRAQTAPVRNGDEAIDVGGAADRSERADHDGGVIERSGEYWVLGYGGRSVQLKDGKGIQYVARLISQPGVEIHAADLQRSSEVAAGEMTAAGIGGSLDLEGVNVRAAGGEDAGAVLDEVAKRQYRERIVALDEEIEEAERFNDPERVAKAREERELIGRELTSAVGLGGRDRKAASQAERARVNVTRAIRNTLDRIERSDAVIGAQLRPMMRTGIFCCYELPPGEATSQWKVRSPDE